MKSNICVTQEWSRTCFSFCQVHEVTFGLFFSARLVGNYSSCQCEIKSAGSSRSRSEYHGSLLCQSYFPEHSCLTGNWIKQPDVCILPAACEAVSEEPLLRWEKVRLISLQLWPGGGRCEGRAFNESHKDRNRFIFLLFGGSKLSRELFPFTCGIQECRGKIAAVLNKKKKWKNLANIFPCEFAATSPDPALGCQLCFRSCQHANAEHLKPLTSDTEMTTVKRPCS